MDLRDLAWLSLLAEFKHLTDTAAMVGVTQPTLSRALARVETELGYRLFERRPAGVVPNPDGDLVVQAARDIIARYERLTTELITRHDPDAGLVRLAFLDSMATSLVPRLLRDFHQHAPGVRVELRQEPGHEILEDLATGRADLAVISPRPGVAHGWFPLQDERLVLIVPPTHRLRSRRRIAVRELADEKLITTPVGFGFRSLVDGLLAEAGIAPEVSFESADINTIEGLVAAGLGIAIAPAQFAGNSGSIGIGLTAAGARRTIGLAWRSDRAPTAVAERFRAFVTGSDQTA